MKFPARGPWNGQVGADLDLWVCLSPGLDARRPKNKAPCAGLERYVPGFVKISIRDSRIHSEPEEEKQ